MQHLLIFARKEQPHVVHLLPVLFTHRASDARARSADLILQTRARAITIHAVSHWRIGNSFCSSASVSRTA